MLPLLNNGREAVLPALPRRIKACRLLRSLVAIEWTTCLSKRSGLRTSIEKKFECVDEHGLLGFRPRKGVMIKCIDPYELGRSSKPRALPAHLSSLASNQRLNGGVTNRSGFAQPPQANFMHYAPLFNLDIVPTRNKL